MVKKSTLIPLIVLVILLVLIAWPQPVRLNSLSAKPFPRQPNDAPPQVTLQRTRSTSSQFSIEVRSRDEALQIMVFLVEQRSGVFPIRFEQLTKDSYAVTRLSESELYIRVQRDNPEALYLIRLIDGKGREYSYFSDLKRAHELYQNRNNFLKSIDESDSWDKAEVINLQEYPALHVERIQSRPEYEFKSLELSTSDPLGDFPKSPWVWKYYLFTFDLPDEIEDSVTGILENQTLSPLQKEWIAKLVMPGKMEYLKSSLIKARTILNQNLIYHSIQPVPIVIDLYVVTLPLDQPLPFAHLIKKDFDLSVLSEEAKDIFIPFITLNSDDNTYPFSSEVHGFLTSQLGHKPDEAPGVAIDIILDPDPVYISKLMASWMPGTGVGIFPLGNFINRYYAKNQETPSGVEELPQFSIENQYAGIVAHEMIHSVAVGHFKYGLMKPITEEPQPSDYLYEDQFNRTVAEVISARRTNYGPKGYRIEPEGVFSAGGAPSAALVLAELLDLTNEYFTEVFKTIQPATLAKNLPKYDYECSLTFSHAFYPTQALDIDFTTSCPYRKYYNYGTGEEFYFDPVIVNDPDAPLGSKLNEETIVDTLDEQGFLPIKEYCIPKSASHPLPNTCVPTCEYLIAIKDTTAGLLCCGWAWAVQNNPLYWIRPDFINECLQQGWQPPAPPAEVPSGGCAPVPFSAGGFSASAYSCPVEAKCPSSNMKCKPTSQGCECLYVEKQKSKSCGDGEIDPFLGEECEKDNDCAPDEICNNCACYPHCGNGKFEPGLGEKCDFNETKQRCGKGGTCNLNCTCSHASACTNEDGTLKEGANCSMTVACPSGQSCDLKECICVGCGDGILQLSEDCDPNSEINWCYYGLLSLGVSGPGITTDCPDTCKCKGSGLMEVPLDDVGEGGSSANGSVGSKSVGF